MPGDHSAEAYVIEEYLDRWSFENDGKGTREITARVRIQSEAGVEHFGVLTFPYENAVEDVQIGYVRARKPDGSVISTTLDEIQDMPTAVTREAPLYSDLHEKQLAVKGLSVGDLLEYQCRWNVTKPLIPGQFWMQTGFEHDKVILQEKIQVRVPRNRPVKFKSPLTPVITDEKEYRTYTWSRSNLETQQRLKSDLITFSVHGSFPASDVELSSFQTWQEIGTWYGGLQQDRVTPSAEIRTKAAELTRNAADDSAKIQAIYKYVSTQYRYIGVDFGIGRYQPHFATEVLNNQYGDCKDKHTLVASLLAAAGIPAYPALISSSHVIEPDVPSPAQFDHVITVVPRGKDLLWLDTTTEVGPLGYLVLPLRDKQALVIFPDKPAAFQMTPQNPPFATSWTFKIDARVDAAGTLEGKVEQTMRGDAEVLLRAGLRSRSRTEWKSLIQRFSYGIGFGGEVSDVTASMPEATDVPLHLAYTYRRKQPAWEDHLISTPVPYVFSVPPEENGKLPERLWLEAPGEFDFESRVELPQGYRPFLPQNKDIKEEFAEYHSTYTAKGNVLIARFHIVVKVAEVSGSAVEEYKTMAEKVSKEQTRFVPLFAGALTSPTDSLNAFMMQVWELPESGDSKAVQAEKDARAAMEHGSFQLAQSALKRALAQDPKCTRDWILLAQVDMELRQEEAVVEGLRKAVDSDRQQPLSYKLLALTLVSRGKRSEAVQVWQDLSKVAPDDTDIPVNLGRLLLAEKRFGEAVPYLEKAVKLDLDANSLLLDLGSAYLQSGADEQATNTFEQALKAQPGEMTKNNIAYAMANANKRLDDALRYSQEAVRGEEEASRAVQLSKLVRDDLRPTLNLGLYWDTLGWVLYRKGDLKRAEGYLYAAWTLCQTPTMGYHLAQLYDQEHRTSDAKHLYRVIATLNSPAGEDAEAIQEAKKRAGNPSTLGWARGEDLSGELSRQRTTILPRLTDQASAEFFVLIGPSSKSASGSQESAGATLQGLIEDVKFVSGSDKLKSSGDLLRQAHIKVALPAESSGKLLRRGVLSCFSLSGCTFVLIPPDWVSQVN